MRVSPSCVTYRIGLIPEPELSRCSSFSVSHPITSWTLADHHLISGCQARGRSIPGQPLRRTPAGPWQARAECRRGGAQVAVCASGPAAYDLSPRCRALQAEELVQFPLLAGELGGHAADPGP